MTIPVHIALRSIIEADGERETIVQHTDGTLERRQDGWVIAYREPDPAMDGALTTVTTGPDGVTVVRTGAYASRLCLTPGAATPLPYDTPYGQLTFAVDTRWIEDTLGPAGGRLVLAYTLTDPSGRAAAHTLTLRVRPAGYTTV